MTHVIGTPEGTITVPGAVLAHIVRAAVDRVDGARVRKARRGGLEVSLEDGRATVSLDLAARHGAVLPELAHAVQEHVARALREMCGLDVASVDVSIETLE